MTVTPKTLVEGMIIPASDTTIYTTPIGCTTILDKLTTLNYDDYPRIATLSIVASGHTVGDAYYVAKKLVQPKETTTWPEMVGQILNGGDFISVISNNATGLNLRISGREVS